MQTTVHGSRLISAPRNCPSSTLCFTLLNLTYYIYMAAISQENSYSSRLGSVPGISWLQILMVYLERQAEPREMEEAKTSSLRDTPETSTNLENKGAQDTVPQMFAAQKLSVPGFILWPLTFWLFPTLLIPLFLTPGSLYSTNCGCLNREMGIPWWSSG